MNKNITKSIIIVLIIIILDQILKIWVKTHMSLGESSFYHWNWGAKWAQLNFIENEGMAFGWALPGNYGKILLSIFRLIAISLIGWYIFKVSKQKVAFGYVLSLSLIFAGALGNMLDSAFYGIIFSESVRFSTEIEPAKLFNNDGYAPFLQGNVVDMLYFPLFDGTYPNWVPFKGGQYFQFFRPIFNIADASITVGVAIILVFGRRFFKDVDEKEKIVSPKNETENNELEKNENKEN